MVRKFLKWLFSWTSTILILAVLAGYAVMQAWPASYWLDNVIVTVFDAPVDEPVIMSVSRDINRPFIADWNVLVRKQAGNNWKIVCTASGRGDYRPDAILPSPVTLDWWTDGQCPNPPEGNIFITTIWTLETLAGNKTVVTQSNVFRVSPL